MSENVSSFPQKECFNSMSSRNFAVRIILTTDRSSMKHSKKEFMFTFFRMGEFRL